MPTDRDDLTDEALREEIELVGELVVAASRHSGPMDQGEVDVVLGLFPAEEPAQPTRTGTSG